MPFCHQENLPRGGDNLQLWEVLVSLALKGQCQLILFFGGGSIHEEIRTLAWDVLGKARLTLQSSSIEKFQDNFHTFVNLRHPWLTQSKEEMHKSY